MPTLLHFLHFIDPKRVDKRQRTLLLNQCSGPVCQGFQQSQTIFVLKHSLFGKTKNSEDVVHNIDHLNQYVDTLLISEFTA